MTNKEFLNILNDASRELNCEEVEKMMYAEIDKEPEEMDAEFIESCAQYLIKHGNDSKKSELSDKITAEKHNKKDACNVKAKSFKLKALLAAAVAAAMLAAAGITAFAAFSPEFKDSVVTFFSDCASINYSDKKTGIKAVTAPKENEKLYKELKKGGVENIMLPKELYTIKHEKLNWQSDGIKKYVTFISGDKKISVTIKSFCDAKYIMNPDIQGDFTAVNKINVNGVDVYLFESSGENPKKVKTVISYQTGLTQYCILYNYSIEKAEEFMKTAE